MATFNRTVIQEFAIANIVYANAKVTAYKVDDDGNRTDDLATLYEDITGDGALENPQILDGEGKWLSPVYIDEPVILAIEGVGTVPDHETGIVGAQLLSDVQSAIDAAAESRRILQLARGIFARLQAEFEELSAFASYHRTGDGVTQSFSIDTEIPTADSVLVSINGVLQHADTYIVDGTDVQFSEAPADGADISIRLLAFSRTVTRLSGNALTLSPLSSAPSSPQDGTLAISDGTGSGFDGSSGAGLYRWNGASWVFIG